MHRVLRMAAAAAVLVVGALAVAGASTFGADAMQIRALGVVALIGAAIAWSSIARAARETPAQLRTALADLEARIASAASDRQDVRMRAETAGRFREEFVAAVRHELKT